MLQKVQTKLEPSGEPSPKKSVAGDNFDFDSLLEDISDDELHFDYEQASKSGLTRIAELVAFGSLDLEDVGDIIGKTSVNLLFD